MTAMSNRIEKVDGADLVCLSRSATSAGGQF